MKENIVKVLKTNLLYSTIILCISVFILVTDLFLSLQYGRLSLPLQWDSPVFFNAARRIHQSFIDGGLFGYIKAIFSVKDPLWDFCLSIPFFIFKSRDDWMFYTARIFPVFLFLNFIFFNT